MSQDSQLAASPTPKGAIKPASSPKREYTPTDIVQKCKYLYTVKGLLPKEIVKKTGIKEKTLSSLIHRYKWVEQRDRIQARALAKLEDKAVSQAQQTMERWGNYSENIGETVFTKLNEELDKDKSNSKAVLDYIRGVKDLHYLVKESAPELREATKSASSINIFLGELERVKPEPKVAPAVDV